MKPVETCCASEGGEHPRAAVVACSFGFSDGDLLEASPANILMDRKASPPSSEVPMGVTAGVVILLVVIGVPSDAPDDSGFGAGVDATLLFAAE